MSPKNLSRIISENKVLNSRASITPTYFNPVPYYIAHPLSYIETNFDYLLSDLQSRLVHSQIVCDEGEADPIFIQYQKILDLTDWITLDPSDNT